MICLGIVNPNRFNPTIFPIFQDVGGRISGDFLSLVDFKTAGDLTTEDRRRIGVVSNLLARNRIGYFESDDKKEGVLMYFNYDTQTGERFDELDQGIKEDIRGVASLLGIRALRNDPAAHPGEHDNHWIIDL